MNNGSHHSTRTSSWRTRTPGDRHRALALWVLLATVALCALAPAARADQTVTLRMTFEQHKASATFMVPADWQVQARRSSVKLGAPSSRPGCTHLLRISLDLLYVASTVTPAGWVQARLSSAGTPFAGATRGDFAWGAALPAVGTTSFGAAAQPGGSGRYGAIMTEVLSRASLGAGCPANQARKAAKRLARVMSGISLVVAGRR